MDDSIPLAHPVVDDEMVAEASRVLREEFFLRGESVACFEAEFATYVATEHAVALDSGTRALHLALEALGVGEGDRVLTTPATFIATANAVRMAGAEPVFADADPATYTLDPDEAGRVVDERDDVAAVVTVHLYGYPADVDALRDAVGDVPIVSDACQAHGASIDGRRVGSLADIAAFSFYPSKNITVAGDGGMLTTDDDDVAARVRSLRDVGRDEASGRHERLGYTARLNTVNAAIGRKQLARLDEWNGRRRRIARTYGERFEDLEGLTCPPSGGPEIDPAWYLYAVRTADRDALQSHLANAGVEAGVNYDLPVHLQAPYRNLPYERGDFPHAERWADEVLCLPVHQRLSDDDVERVAGAVEGFFEGSR